MKVINLVVDKVIKAVMAVSGIVLMAVTFWQVVCRYVLKAPLPWSQDIIRLSFTYLVFWGAAYCVHEKANLNVDVLLTSLPKVIGKLLEIIINVVLVGFFRAGEFVNYLRVKYAGKCILAVGHGAFNRAILTYLNGGKPADMVDLPIMENTSVIRLSI